MIASGDRRTGENVDAALDHAVPAPGEDQLRALVEGTFDRSGSLPALRHLAPQRVGDSLVLEDATELGEPTLERLAGVGNDCDLHRRSRSLPCLGGRAGGPAGEDDHDHGCDADDDSARDVERVVHAAIHA